MRKTEMRKIAVYLASAVLFVVGGFAIALAQTVIIPTVTNVAVADLLQVIVGGAPSAGNTYGTAGKVTHTESYVNGGTITTDPAYTFASGVTNWLGHKASGLTTGTFTTEAAPKDGNRECVWLDQTTTTLTWTANTGQTVDSTIAHAAGIANVPNCITFQASNSTWYASP
jgi:type IV secretory pathway TrbL component